MEKARPFGELKVRDVMSRRVERAKPDQKIGDFLSSEHLGSIPIIEDGKLVGLIDHRRLMHSRIKSLDEEVKRFAVMPPTFEGKDWLTDVVRVLVESEFRAVPVLKNGRVHGMISLQDIAKAMSAAPEFTKMRASEIMTENPMTITPETTLGKAMDLMIKNGISRLPVMEGERIAGLLSFHDILEKFWRPRFREGYRKKRGKSGREELLSLPVKGFMTREIVSVGRGASLFDIAKMTDRFGISDVIVAENGKLIGIITPRDIVSAARDLATGRTITFTFSGTPLSGDDQEYMKREVESLYQKTLHPIQAVDFHIKDYTEKGLRQKYSVHAKVKTDYGFFTASACRWNLIQTFDECVKELERMIEEKKEITTQRTRRLKHTFKTYE
jgi:CBS domain-containing protein/ribosome-associated translation inhibitor RaiA